MNPCLHFKSKIFSFDKWCPLGFFFFFSEYKGFEIRRPLIPLSICVGNGGSQLSLEKGKGGWLYFRLQSGRGVREEVEISHLLFADDIPFFFPFVGKKRKKIWKSIPLYIFWTVWKERNRL